MTDELDDPFAPTELHGFEGTLLDPNWWEVRRARLEELGRPALWYWEEEWQPYQVSMGPNRKAAPIAEGGREIVEQAKEEAFLAWGL
jgi:hypothetical protein